MNAVVTYTLEIIPVTPMVVGAVILIVAFLFRKFLKAVVAVGLAVLAVCAVTVLVDIPGMQNGTFLTVGLHGYEIVPENYSYEEAQKRCAAYGGHLLDLTSGLEYQVISQKLERMELYGTVFYIGSASEELDIDSVPVNYMAMRIPDVKIESSLAVSDQGSVTRQVRLYYDSEEECWNCRIVPKNAGSQYLYSNTTGYVCEYSIPALIVRKIGGVLQKSL